MTINNFVLMKAMMELDSVITRSNASVFKLYTRNYCQDLASMLSGARKGSSVNDIVRNTGYDDLNGLQTLTLSGFGPHPEGEAKVVIDEDVELIKSITEMAELLLGDHPIVVSKVVIKKAYVENMCVHHYVDIDFQFSIEKLKKFLK